MKKKPARIAHVDGAGFCVCDDAGEQAVRWDQVQQVTAFKRDLYTVDMLCLLLLYGVEGKILEVNEQMEGYNDLVGAMETHLPNATPWAAWFFAVAFPAFAANSLCIYRQNGVPDPIPEAPPASEEELKLTWIERATGAFWGAVISLIYATLARFEKKD